MKKIISYTLALILGLVLSSSGCYHDSMEPDFDYIGTWKLEDDLGKWITVTISSDNTFMYETNMNDYTEGFVMNNLTWTPKINPTGFFFSTFPTGYTIKGKVASLFGSFPIPKADGSPGNATVGVKGIMWWYISTDGMKIAVGDPNSPDHEAINIILTKQ